MRPLSQEHVVLGKRFALAALTASAGWTARTLFLLGSALVSALLLGACFAGLPGVSVRHAVERSHALFLPGFLLSLGLGLALGVDQALLGAVGPSRDETKQGISGGAPSRRAA